MKLEFVTTMSMSWLTTLAIVAFFSSQLVYSYDISPLQDICVAVQHSNTSGKSSFYSHDNYFFMIIKLRIWSIDCINSYILYVIMYLLTRIILVTVTNKGFCNNNIISAILYLAAII